jgi:UDP-N-acetylglucosamine 4,6-dehydratase
MNKIKSILVTGGTGSFGQAFVRFLLDSTDIPRICVYSRGEHAQAALRAAINDDPRVRYMVGDVRDLARLTRACRGIDAVVHAAALKRIETGAYNPDEMVKTNVIGSMNVIEAAMVTNVKWVVGLSSDKAFEPVSPYGQSKALGESLLLAANIYGGPKFACTRYGNIWNAQGSIIPKWLALAEQGKYITVTDPECTRFFMTIHEAVKMVWYLAETMVGGELIIPEWLPAYKVGDLATAFNMFHATGVQYTGLPKFEKLHESMNSELCSKDARRMSIVELKELIKNV